MTNSLPSRVCVPARGCVCTCMHAVVQIRVHVIGCARVRPCACMICGMQAFASRSKCVHVHDVYVVPPIQSFSLPSFLCCPSHILPSFLHPSLPPFTYTLSLSLSIFFSLSPSSFSCPPPPLLQVKGWLQATTPRESLGRFSGYCSNKTRDLQ